MTVRNDARCSRGSVALAVVASLALSLSGCAEFAEWMSFDSPAEKAINAKMEADRASLWEMTLMAGRYGVMLDQAREILNLPEPKNAPSFPTDATDDLGQRKALASYQVSVANQFFADAARACKKRRIPASVRAIACKDQKPVAAVLRAPVPADVAALSTRNDQVGDVIMPWWDAVCAHAPKEKEDDVPACAME
ncbi:MAG: hypothetical protein K8S25_12075 [Alphaproteobacteria bacterium]|nr:hypothetical protein [Alphaproteobacteria bacterium]